jgi:hypothetical protein
VRVMELRNPNFGCLKIAQQISYASDIELDKDGKRRVLQRHYAGLPHRNGPNKPSSSTEGGEQSSRSPNKDRWGAQRALEKPDDRMPSLEALAWLDALPQGVRPHNPG